MQDWGKGMLQSGREYHIISDYDEKFGLRELRVKIYDKAGFVQKNLYPFRLSIDAEFCYGASGEEMSRKCLDSGPLKEEFAVLTTPERLSASNTLFKLLTIAAGAMTLGCIIPADIMKTLKQLVQTKNSPAFCTEDARKQMQKAVLSYVDGTPYDFGNITMNENMIGKMFPGSKITLTTVGASKHIEMTTPNGKVIPSIIGAPSDEELGVTPVHEYHVCASCGSEELKSNGSDKLLRCGSCKVRRYCSKACQRKNWPLHKPICSRPAQEMENFLDSIPLDFGKDARLDLDKKGGPSPVVVNGNSAGDVLHLM